MSDKNFKLNIEINPVSTLETEIAKLEKLVALKKELSGNVSIISDKDTQKLISALNAEEGLTKAIKAQSDTIDEKTKALQKLATAQSEQAVEIAQIKELTTLQNKENKEAAKDALGLTSEYDKLNKKLKEYKKELVTLEPGTAKFNEAASAAGHIKNKIDDAKSAVKAFATTSKAQTAKTLFGQVADDIGNLNFEGAAEKAKQFAGVMKSISFSEVIGGIKSFASSIISVGEALLSNPFGIVLLAITAVGLALKEFFDSADAGSETLNKLNEELIAVEKSTRDLERATRDLAIQNDIEAGKVSKRTGEKILAENKYQDAFLDLQEERKAKTA